MQRNQIVTFWGSSSPFSNWNPSRFEWNGIEFNCGEQYMMYRKAMLFGDNAIAAKILAEPEPSKQKSLGRQVQNFMKPVWDALNIPIMVEGLLPKFTQSAHHQAALLATEDKLIIEASPSDLVWGVGLAAADDRILEPALWRGQNRLGTVLMAVRAAVKASAKSDAPAQAALFA